MQNIKSNNTGGQYMARMTLEEIAKEIGISRTTIYKVMTGSGSVSEKTQQAVQEALHKYHYVQNKNARNLAMNRQYTVAYIGFTSKSAGYFSREVKKGIARAVKEFGDDGLLVQISEFELEKPGEQIRAVEQMLDQGVRSFVLAFSDSEAIREIMTLLRSRECRAVLLSRDFEENRDIYYVGVDYYQSGRLAAEILGKTMPKGGRVLIPVTAEYHANRDIRSRLQGFLDKAQEYPKLEILPPVFDLVEPSKIREELTGYIQKQGVSGIFDLTYRLDVVADTLKALGREEIALTGFDFFPEIEAYLRDSVIDAVVYQDLKRQAYLAIKLLFEEMCYQKSGEQQKIYSKLEIIMKENMAYFID